MPIPLPALNRARQQAQQTACLSNLRQIGAAAVMHAKGEGVVGVPF